MKNPALEEGLPVKENPAAAAAIPPDAVIPPDVTIPPDVKRILSRLAESGHEAYLVGGCVRDLLLGRAPEDWDITTSAKPDEVKAVFPRTVDTGIQHGTVGVLLHGRAYEVTTYRVDGDYEDGRHPKQVTFTPNLAEDLARRDFTVNAMAYSPETGLVDVFGGLGDLREGRIRCVGKAAERFSEDALRMLRALRFSAQLGFAIEGETYAAIGALAPNLEKVSRERVQVELTKLLLSSHPETIRKVYETGLGAYVSPAFAALSWQEAEIPAALPAKKTVRWAAFLRVASPGEAEQVLRDLKLDNATIANVKKLVARSAEEIPLDAPAVRRAMSQFSPELWDDYLDLTEAPESLRALTKEIRARGDCLGLGGLAVTGQDLIKAGIKPGKRMGEILSALLDLVLEDPSRNNKEFLLSALDSFPVKNETSV